MQAFTDQSAQPAIPIHIVLKGQLSAWAEGQDESVRAWITANGFTARAGTHCLLPSSTGDVDAVLVGAGDEADLYTLSPLVSRLPKGAYALAAPGDEDLVQLCVGWGLAHYQYTRYRSVKPRKTQLVWPDGVDRKQVEAIVSAQCLVRDMVTTPTEDMGPDEVQAAVEKVAKKYGAPTRTLTGDQLLEENFPAVHVVGRASHRPPRLVELNWGQDSDPLVCVIGKGVCFDTGGLNLKSATGMRLMKKDMGGAAHALGLAQLIMEHALPVRLKLLIPTVENSVSGNAYRPGDVINTRQGLRVEIGNTDAEGRIIMSDALTLASESKPDFIVDFATLTGAARVALGTDLPAMFCNDAQTARRIWEAGEQVQDPVWEMPLYAGYKRLLKSPVADLNNISSSGMGGAITAALFLESFVGKGLTWCHIDTFAWNQKSRPGRPEGGEALSMRAVFAYLQNQYT